MNHPRAIITLLTTLLLITPSLAHGGGDSDEERSFSKGAGWGLGLAASFVTSSTGFIMSGLLILVLKSKRLSQKTLNTIITVLIAFAVGTLLGDAVVHIMPEVFGAHEHGEEETEDHSDEAEAHADEHSHEEEEESEPIASITSLLILAGFVSFILIERTFEALGIQHSHGPKESHSHDSNHVHPHSPKTDVQVTELKGSEDDKEKQTLQPQDNQAKQEFTAKKETSWWKRLFSFTGRGTSGIMILMADFLHNIMDGLAIGVTFASGKKNLCISTFVAILAHEIPQELGDMGILVASNFPMSQALCWNGMVNFSAMIGTVIGLAIGSLNEAANAYVLAFVAGNFLYISLVSMLPVISGEKRPKHALGLLLAFCVGAGCMFAILAAED